MRPRPGGRRGSAGTLGPNSPILAPAAPAFPQRAGPGICGADGLRQAASPPRPGAPEGLNPSRPRTARPSSGGAPGRLHPPEPGPPQARGAELGPAAVSRWAPGGAQGGEAAGSWTGARFPKAFPESGSVRAKIIVRRGFLLVIFRSCLFFKFSEC